MILSAPKPLNHTNHQVVAVERSTGLKSFVKILLTYASFFVVIDDWLNLTENQTRNSQKTSNGGWEANSSTKACKQGSKLAWRDRKSKTFRLCFHATFKKCLWSTQQWQAPTHENRKDKHAGVQLHFSDLDKKPRWSSWYCWPCLARPMPNIVPVSLLDLFFCLEFCSRVGSVWGWPHATLFLQKYVFLSNKSQVMQPGTKT